MANTVWDRIEEARARHDVLQHPFYIRWSAGELTSDELARYSGQYRHAVTAIADLSDEAAAELPEHPELAGHADEERAHIEMWDGFVDAVGGDSGAAANAETAQCVEVWTERDGALSALGPPVRDRERPAGDLEDQARGPRRPLRRRLPGGHALLHGPPRPRRRACRRGSGAARGADLHARRRGRRRRRRGARLRGQLAPPRRRLGPSSQGKADEERPGFRPGAPRSGLLLDVCAAVAAAVEVATLEPVVRLHVAGGSALVERAGDPPVRVGRVCAGAAEDVLAVHLLDLEPAREGVGLLSGGGLVVAGVVEVLCFDLADRLRRALLDRDLQRHGVVRVAEAVAGERVGLRTRRQGDAADGEYRQA